MNSSDRRINFNELRSKMHTAKYQGTDTCVNVSELCVVLRREYDLAYPFVDHAAAPESPGKVSAAAKRSRRKSPPQATESEAAARRTALKKIRASGRPTGGSKRTAFLPPVDTIAYRTLHGALPSDVNDRFGLHAGSNEAKKDRSVTAGGAGMQKSSGLMLPPVFTPQLGTPTWKKSARQTRIAKQQSLHDGSFLDTIS
jgi:hypothetical protein